METLFLVFGVPLLAWLYGLYVYISDRRQEAAQSPKTDYSYLRGRYPRGDAVFFTDNGSFTNSGSGGLGFSDGGFGSCTDGGGGGGGS
jgi:hypothetical protein